MTYQIDFLCSWNYSCLSRCLRARIVVVKSDASSPVGSPNFLKVNDKQIIGSFLVSEQLFSDLVHHEIPIQSTVVYFRAHTHTSTMYHMSVCHKRVSKHRYRIFWAFSSARDWQILWDPKRTDFFTVKCLCNFEYNV